ncbi:hypothetical protein PRA76_27340, partial [Klebsiella pneumoniae]|uniref:hypothetical protein n=1 Tax=Klebsiella pneumoniae TaxID=573 RepID=UPI002E815E43
FDIDTTNKEGSLVLRDKVFANLDSDSPTIRSITDEKGEEFVGKVVSRAEDAVFLTWNNDPFGNKLWSAAIDLVNKKAVVSQVYKGITSTGIDSETLDCS